MDMTIDPALTSAADEHDALAAVPSFLQKTAAMDVTEIFGGIGASVAQEPTPATPRRSYRRAPSPQAWSSPAMPPSHVTSRCRASLTERSN